MSSKMLEFVPISSSINPSFWNKLSEIKLNVDKLEEKKHSIWGYFTNINNKCNIPILEINSTSFNTDFESQKIYIPFHGRILNMNTVEQFKECNKGEIMNEIGREIFEMIENGKALDMPSLLNQFFVLSFADLKKFTFYYWFAFPVPGKLTISNKEVKKISDVFSVEQLEAVWEHYCGLDNHQKPFFLLQHMEETVNLSTLKDGIKNIDNDNKNTFYFGFYDISLMENCPGTTLRNYATLILHHCSFLQGKSVNFLSLRLTRDEDFKLSMTESLIFNLELPICQPSISDFLTKDPQGSWVGWEKNERGKLGPRISNMKKFLDPKELAESSVDLNLKLMKWRLLSNIDLEIIKTTKFLLLGSGTLGCSVARILLGWGSRHITFVDNSTVSYSNPVRQSLFTFEDSKNAAPKSMAAAENLRKIFPGVKTQSFQLSIPMPGHPVGESMLEQVKKDVETLTNLIEENDVIFLLMDSRESRYLPTLLGTYNNKIVINAALGFDSYLVMRHGVRVDLKEFKVRQHVPGFKSLKGNYLGCYFCNDVTAPGDSMKDRTLDQQCTVTRPGVSAIAGALAAELAISILQHKEGPKAAAFFQIGNVQDIGTEIDNHSILGLIPHSIRGYLSTFSQVLPATERYNLCVACSDIVQRTYHKEGFEFLLKVFNDPRYLEDLTGLSKLTEEAENIGIWEFSDEEEIGCTSYDDENKSVEVDGSQSELTVKDQYYVETEEDRVSESKSSGTIIAIEKENPEPEVQNIPSKSLENKSSFTRLAENIFQKFLSKVEPNDDNMKINTISSSDFVNTILEDIKESPENEKNAEIPQEVDPFKKSLSKLFAPPEDIQKTNSRSLIDSELAENVPREIIPILEQQHQKMITDMIKSSKSKFKIISLKSRVKNFISSISLMRDDESIDSKSKISCKSPEIPENYETKGADNYNASIVTIKPKIENFLSSESATDIEFEKSEYLNNVLTVLPKQIMQQSSGSLFLDTKSNFSVNERIITLAKPQELFSSSDNLENDDSIYYLAETDSESKLKR